MQQPSWKTSTSAEPDNRAAKYKTAKARQVMGTPHELCRGQESSSGRAAREREGTQFPQSALRHQPAFLEKKKLFQWEITRHPSHEAAGEQFCSCQPRSTARGITAARPLPGHSSSPPFRYCSRNRSTLSGTKRLQHVFCCLHFCLHPSTVFAFSQQDKVVDSCLASDPV